MSEEQTELPIEEKTQVEPDKGLIKLSKRRSLAPRNHAELARVLEQINAGKGFPARFDTPQKRLAAYNLANALMGERWQLAINNVAEIKGQMSIFGELPGALAEQTGQVAEKRLFLVDKEYKEINFKNLNFNAEPWAAVCIIQRTGRSKKEFFYTLDEAKKAGQYPAKRRDGSINDDSPWMKHTKTMLMRKAMALAIKFEFPDALIGVPVAEYDYDVAPDLGPTRDVTGTPGVADELNKFVDEQNQLTQ